MKNVIFLLNDSNPEQKLSLEVDRVTAFGIIEQLMGFIENCSTESHKAIFLHFTGELVDGSQTVSA